MTPHGPMELTDGVADAARRRLRKADPRLRRIIDDVGPYTPSTVRDPLIAMIGAVVQQQVSLSAATAIYRRLRTCCPRNRITAPALLALDEATLRGVGLSRQKAAYVRNVAEAFVARRLTRAKLHAWSDDEVVEHTTCIKGVGRWTAEMLLIFCLQRPDVWPVDDLGLRKGVMKLLDLPEMPAPRDVQALGEPWRPYRTWAALYLWRSLEGPLTPGIAL